MKRYLIIDPKDSVAVALEDLSKGETAEGIILSEDIPRGHKFALRDLAEGAPVIKYGAPIGLASRKIIAGARVHTHNLASGLSKQEYRYEKTKIAASPEVLPTVFEGYRRSDGRVGTRNVLYIIPTVGCIGSAARALEVYGNSEKRPGVDRVVALLHPYGCSQLGDDHKNTQRILGGILRNPNAGGVLVLGLGCENNNLAEFRKTLGATDPERVLFLNAQDTDDEITEGKRLLNKLLVAMSLDVRTPAPLADLTVGVKCGGSDGLSGITANPLIGRMTDRLAAAGAKIIMTEVPEMFGAEERLLERAKDRTVFQKGVGMINGFKDYFSGYGVPIYENPSPGNREGGITTLEEKSLGCTQKSGACEVADVVEYGGAALSSGLNLLNGPGNDIVAVSALAAAGATLILFSTGRGTPLGAPVPVIKISSNTPLARKKTNWIDFDAGALLSEDPDGIVQSLTQKISAVASGAPTKAESNGIYDFAIFKNGVTL